MRYLTFLSLLAFISNCALAVSDSEIASFASEIARPLKASRYMEGTCTPVSVQGWAGFETRRCIYSVEDKPGSVKRGLVILLNPSQSKLSAWILNACEAIQPSEALFACAHRVFNRVIEQSGGQFPVAGIVYEDLRPKDGVQEAYGFRDGVTTVLKGVKHRGTRALEPADLDAALIAPPLTTASCDAPARVVGVSRYQYLKLHPTANVRNLSWLDIVRQEHQKAMNSDHNALIEAWLAANPPLSQ